MQNTENWNASHPSNVKQMLSQEYKTNLELVKKIMTEKKTTLLSLRKQDWKNTVETEKVKKYSNWQYHWTKWVN